MKLPFITLRGKDMCFTPEEMAQDVANQLRIAPDYNAAKIESDYRVWKNRVENSAQAVRAKHKQDGA